MSFLPERVVGEPDRTESPPTDVTPSTRQPTQM
jgi:hypothetical protein